MNATGVKVNAKSLMKEKVPAISDSKSARTWSMDVKGTEIGAEMKDMATVVAELEAPNKSGEELDKALYVGRRSFRRGRREWGGHTCSGKIVKRNIKTCSGKVQYKTCGLCVNAVECAVPYTYPTRPQLHFQADHQTTTRPRPRTSHPSGSSATRAQQRHAHVECEI